MNQNILWNLRKIFPDYFSDITDEARKISFYKEEIIYFSKSKEELEAIITSNKYNI